MKIKTYILLACTMSVALCASAQTLPKTSPSPSATSAGPAAMPGTQTTATTSASPGAKQRAIPFHGTISSTDAKAKSFTIAGKEKARTFKITDKTAITKNGQSATIKDVAAKDEARGSYWKMPDGSMEVKTLKLGPATDQTKAAQEKKDGGKKEASPSPSPTASPSASPH